MFFPELGLFMSLSFHSNLCVPYDTAFPPRCRIPFEDTEGGTFLQFLHSGGGGEQRTALTT